MFTLTLLKNMSIVTSVQLLKAGSSAPTHTRVKIVIHSCSVYIQSKKRPSYAKPCPFGGSGHITILSAIGFFSSFHNYTLSADNVTMVVFQATSVQIWNAGRLPAFHMRGESISCAFIIRFLWAAAHSPSDPASISNHVSRKSPLVDQYSDIDMIRKRVGIKACGCLEGFYIGEQLCLISRLKSAIRRLLTARSFVRRRSPRTS